MESDSERQLAGRQLPIPTIRLDRETEIDSNSRTERAVEHRALIKRPAIASQWSPIHSSIHSRCHGLRHLPPPHGGALPPGPVHRPPPQLSPSARPFQPSRVVLVRWTPPPRGWFKINFDGSVYHDGSGRASIGGAIRDSAGRVVLAFAERTEHSTVGIVEARAMARGLRLALELGLQRVVVEGDDLVLAQLLRGEETQTRIPVATQEEIVGLLRCFPGRDVRHVYREGNQVAHTLCRQAYHGPGVWIGGRHPLPPAVWEKSEDDRRGVVHERTVDRAA